VKLFGFEFGTKAQGDTLTIDQMIERIDALARTAAGITVSPDNCEQSPTVQAIVQAISGHFQALPIHVYKQTVTDGVVTKEWLPSHPVAKLLAKPNTWQTSVDYFGDAASTLVRHGRFFAIKGQGVTGPIRWLSPVNPGSVTLEQDLNDASRITARITLANGGQRTYEPWEYHYVRLRARDFLNGDSPVIKASEAIALEIAAQQFGAEFFGNGAVPGMIFEYMENFKGHQSAEARKVFVDAFQAAYGGKKKFRSLLLPAGIKTGELVPVDNDKAQFLDTRKLQRNIIAGAFGVPPHLVGDLERGTFSNIEHQSQEFVNKVILPHARVFEAAMERDLLTDDDRRSGIKVRFNLDAINRADFKTRQEGLKIQREMGVINADEWREREGMNPIAGGKGQTYWEQGPSGQNMGASGNGSEGEDDASASQRSA
jgi:HK97 family phage portal protein